MQLRSYQLLRCLIAVRICDGSVLIDTRFELLAVAIMILQLMEFTKIFYICVILTLLYTKL
jgi:hypothetical protein